MFFKVALFALVVSLFSGCASVPMASLEESNQAKQFNAPSEGHAGLYIYRKNGVGSALKKDIWVDDKCIGESAPDVFFYEEVEGDKNHKISTESEFSPNDMNLYTKSGENYFINQYIKMGVFVGGANLALTGTEQGKKDIAGLDMAIKGTCSN